MAHNSSLEKSSMWRKWWPLAGGSTPTPVYVCVFSRTALARATDLLQHVRESQIASQEFATLSWQMQVL